MAVNVEVSPRLAVKCLKLNLHPKASTEHTIKRNDSVNRKTLTQFWGVKEFQNIEQFENFEFEKKVLYDPLTPGYKNIFYHNSPPDRAPLNLSTKCYHF